MISDSATVAGGYSPTGTVTFNLYNNANGTGTPLFTDANEPLSGGVATSASYTAMAAGTDYWVATYNGDANNVSVSSGFAGEPATVGPATPTINTLVSTGSAVVGTAISDSATVSGGYSPTGTVTFNLYNNANGTGTPLFTDADEPLSGGVATSTGYTTIAPGSDYWVATYNGDANNTSVSSGLAAEPVTVGQATPAIGTTASAGSIVLGGAIADTATVSGGDSPTGTVTFNLYDNANGTGTPLFTDANVPLSGGVASSQAIRPPPLGTRLLGGDLQRRQQQRQRQQRRGLGTGGRRAGHAGDQHDRADRQHRGGRGDLRHGDRHRRLQPDRHGHLQPVHQSQWRGDAVVHRCQRAAFRRRGDLGRLHATATGSDYWVATYNGDGNNVSVSSAAAAEPVTVGPATPAISTTVSDRQQRGGQGDLRFRDGLGGYSPSGTVTFNLYNNPNGEGTPLFTDANEPLSGGAATSTSYTTNATGSDYWVATYNGDGNNVSVSSGVAAELVTVGPATPAISTTVSTSSIVVGGAISDSATVSGGYSPSGTVTFNLYNNANGTGTPLFTDANQPISGGVATSTSFTTTATGTDYWVATYNGDGNNVSVSSGVAAELVTVGPATPAISTTVSTNSIVVGGVDLRFRHGLERL